MELINSVWELDMVLQIIEIIQIINTILRHTWEYNLSFMGKLVSTDVINTQLLGKQHTVSRLYA